MTFAGGAEPVRQLAFAGSWYDADDVRLGADIDAWLSEAPPVNGDVISLVAPHAGLRYSGRIAAWSYAALAGRSLEAVVLIGPSHYVAFRGCAMLRAGAMATPWRPLPIHSELAGDLLSATPLLSDERRDVHDQEHSLELHLPLLARVQPDVPVVPILMGEQNSRTAEALANALATTLSGRAVVVAASSDLSHFHPRTVARSLDAPLLDCFDRRDAEGLMAILEHDPGRACGGGPVVAALGAAVARGADDGGVRQYGDSGDVSGDVARVVGYASAVWTRRT